MCNPQTLRLQDILVELSLQLVGLGLDQRSLVHQAVRLVGPRERPTSPDGTQLLEQDHVLVVDFLGPAGSHVGVRLGEAIPDFVLGSGGHDVEATRAGLAACLDDLGGVVLRES